MSNVKVSVIIPVYNVEKYLRECLESVINQTLTDIEIICINDGSKDNSLSILKEYAQKDERIKIIDKKNEGVAVARNLGIKISKGEFVCFIDPDDYYPYNDILETLFNKAIENKVYICGGEFSHFTNDNPTLTQYFDETATGYLFPQDKLINYTDYQFDYGYHRFIYNKAFLIKNKIFYPKYKRFQDPPFFVHAMICANKFYGIHKITYAYRLGHQQINWTKDKVHDLLKGIRDDMRFAYKYDLPKLANYSIIRLEQHYASIANSIDLKAIYIINQMKRYNADVENFCTKNHLNTLLFTIKQRLLSETVTRTHKVITILGIKIKVKREKRKCQRLV